MLWINIILLLIIGISVISMVYYIANEQRVTRYSASIEHLFEQNANTPIDQKNIEETTQIATEVRQEIRILRETLSLEEERVNMHG